MTDTETYAERIIKLFQQNGNVYKWSGINAGKVGITVDVDVLAFRMRYKDEVKKYLLTQGYMIETSVHDQYELTKKGRNFRGIIHQKKEGLDREYTRNRGWNITRQQWVVIAITVIGIIVTILLKCTR